MKLTFVAIFVCLFALSEILASDDLPECEVFDLNQFICYDRESIYDKRSWSKYCCADASLRPVALKVRDPESRSGYTVNCHCYTQEQYCATGKFYCPK